MSFSVSRKGFKKRVAHVKSPFLPLSETFIYSWVANHIKYMPFVVSEYTVNQDSFPVENIITQRSADCWYESALTTARNYLVQHYPYELFMAGFYKRALKRINPDVMHVHFGIPAMKLVRIKNKIDIPMITTFYGYDLSQAPLALGEDIYVRTGLFEAGEAFTAEGTCARQRLVELGCPAEKTHILHIGVDMSKFEFFPRTPQPGERCRILFCGRFVEKKGLLFALQALGLVHNAGKDFEFFIIGSGEQRHEADRIISETGIDKNVRFIGFVPYADLPKWYRKCHIFLAPSVTDSRGETEGGAPTTIIEAQATGMPVVSSLHADIPEVVIDGKTGLLAPERDIQTLARHISFLIDNPDRWPEMGAHARTHIETEYNIRRQIILLESIYDKCIG